MMNTNGDLGLDEPGDSDWAAMRELYRSEEPSLVAQPAKRARAAGSRWLLRAVMLASLGFVSLVSASLGDWDPVQIALACLVVPAWLFATTSDLYGEHHRRRERSKDTEAFLREDGRWLARQGRTWHWLSVILTVAGVITLLRGGTELLEMSTRAHVAVGDMIQWIGFLASMAGMWALARGRSTQLARETELHAELEDEPGSGTSSRLTIPHSQSRVVLLASLVVVGVMGAVLSWALPEDADDEIFGRADSPKRVLIVSEDGEALSSWLDGMGFESSFMTREGMSSTLDVGQQEGPEVLSSLIEYADHEGFGFVVIDFEAISFEFEARDDLILPEEGRRGTDRFAALSIGDLVYSDNELSYGGAEDALEFSPIVRSRIGLARAIFSQPVMVEISDGRSPLLFTPAFLTDAVREMDRLEAHLPRGEVPARWDIVDAP
jgi:hypothetical protein